MTTKERSGYNRTNKNAAFYKRKDGTQVINVDLSKLPEISPKDWQSELSAAHEALLGGTGKGSDFLGWLRLPEAYDRDEFARIQRAAEKIQSDSDVLLVIGIGGSYLGARAVIEFLQGTFYNLRRHKLPEVYFVGNNLSAAYMAQLSEIIGDRNFSINVISKSGTTTEPAVAFRVWKQKIEEKYGKAGAAERIYVTTDKARGALRGLCDKEGYESFVIPDSVGGRFSVLTAVGLLPIAAAGVDIAELMRGAADMMKLCLSPGQQNPAWQYAMGRNAMYRAGKRVEILACYDPDFVFMAEWFKQLYGESEGKEGKGLFPAAVSYTADLHSMGQYIQEGRRELLETVVLVEEPTASITIKQDAENVDGLNFLAGKTLPDIEYQAFCGTLLAHVDGGVPNMVVRMSKKDTHGVGQLIYFFEIACGLSGYLLGVNPFDQPGVEAYKTNMFALLGKPGFEAQGEALRARL